MFSKVCSHMRHSFVAYLALFFALSGTAVAAKPMITGQDIQDESVTGADILNDSLTGNDVLESSLGIVPNADTLDGINSSGFLQSGSSITGANIVDGSLDARDFGKASGVTTVDFLSIPASSCQGWSVSVAADVGSPVLVSQSPATAFDVSVHATSVHQLFVFGTQFEIRVCNLHGFAIDPPAIDFSWIVFDLN